ncbi:MAG TPA: helix-turn-helix transcriptional regulator [Terriglobales bacterium]|nr:helix-turn-helix transcriptional regulator [Terriglobales bacterium]
MKNSDVTERDHTNVGLGPTGFAAILFGAIAVLIGFDIVADYRSGTQFRHVAVEGLVMALAIGGVATLWRRFRIASRRATELTIDIEAARREAQRYREEAAEALKGLGEAIEKQFVRWGLTPAEREVGLLILKGLSHKEIAGIRSTTETTIRQQALGVYRKSGVRSRTELSAYFLEDLLLPVQQR